LSAASPDEVADVVRALIIDDDGLLRAMTAEALREDGIEVLEADSGERGLERYDAEQPDLVLLDVMMPGIDGYEVCRKLRTRPRGALLPVIMLTGLDDPDSVQSAFDAGATDFLAKPINWALLRFRIRYVLRSTLAVRSLAQSEASLASAQRLAHLGSWEWSTERGTIERSENYYALFGTTRAAFGEGVGALLRHVHAADRPGVEAAYALARTGRGFDVTYRIALADGTLRTVHESAECRAGIAGDGTAPTTVVGTIQDISRQVESERRIRQLAYFDTLTRLPNRVLFRERLHGALAKAARAGKRCTVLVLDLDRFGRINETLGPEFGDRALRAIARRLREGLLADPSLALPGPADSHRPLAARLAGDTFGVLLTMEVAQEELHRFALRLVEHLRAPLSIEDQELRMDAHVGVAFAPDHAASGDALLKAAETALNRAKRSDSPDPVAVFTGGMESSARLRFLLESDLRRTIDDGDLEVHYQPIVDAVSLRMVKAEALARWQHPTRGAVSPTEFIPLAEESRLMRGLTRFVIDRVLADIDEMRAQLPPGFRASINLAPVNIQDARFIPELLEALRRHHVDPGQIEFEITESALMHDVERAAETLASLKTRGFRFAVDDFGTGYSSLSYLRRFPVDSLKIDGSFVRDIAQQRGSGIVDAIIGVARSLELEVVAECVETAAQVAALQRRGCTLMQGFLFARPLRKEALLTLLADGATTYLATDFRRSAG
jgi:diguanylate cyclase (GGDEF)-like protein